MISILNNLEKGKNINPKCTIWESTDDCSKQYRYHVSLYFLYLFSSKFNTTIDRMIGVPGNGKDIVDTINNYNKRYLKEKITWLRLRK